MMTRRKNNSDHPYTNGIERRLLKDRRTHPFFRFFLSLIGYHNRVQHPFSRIMLSLLTYACGLTIYTSTAVLSNPQGGIVTSGMATITNPTTNSEQINQTSRNAIINWQSFNIGAGQKTHFQQPAGGITLNRINSQQGASQIYGTLTATGEIILVNSSGMLLALQLMSM